MGGKGKRRTRKGRAGEEWRGGNGREERASHTTAALGLAKPQSPSSVSPSISPLTFYSRLETHLFH